jgi:hypothetical protein
VNDVNHGDGTWDVTYPSGKAFTVRGVFVVGRLPGCDDEDAHPVVFEGGLTGNGPVLVLDPRAVVRNAAGVVVYLGPDELKVPL